MSTASHLPAIDERVIAAFLEAAVVFKAPPKMTLTEWAEANCTIPNEASSSPGSYSSDIAPYQRGMHDCVHIPGVGKVTFFTAGQVGKSKTIENMLQYFIEEEPCPIIFVWPTEKVAKDWSQDTLDPIIRDNEKLKAKIQSGSRKSANQALYKKFHGGGLSIIGANSPSELRRRRAKVVFFEEVDAYKLSAGGEGDPRKLIEKRQETFWDSLQIQASTCTFEGKSAIVAAYGDSNMQKYWVPCPHCSQMAKGDFNAEAQRRGESQRQNLLGESQEQGREQGQEQEPGRGPSASLGMTDAFVSPAVGEENRALRLDGYQVLHWYRKEGVPGGMYIDPKAPHSGTAYECKWCATLIDESHKPWMLKHGEWRAERPERVAHQGFWLSTLYSPFMGARWAKLAESYLEAKAHPENPELLKAFTNMTLAKPWREKYRAIVGSALLELCEDWSSLPDKVTVLTAGVDVQEDRLEIQVKGWGKGAESWSVDWLRIDGDTSAQATWDKLDAFLMNARYLHARGVRLDIASAFIDTGFRAADVFAYTGTGDRWERRVCACRGRAGFDKPPVEGWSRNNKLRQKVYPVNVDVVKELIHDRLQYTLKGGKGAGTMHFRKEKNDQDFFDQLTSEKMEWGQKNGFAVRKWVKPAGRRNEALDTDVYATAAFMSLDKEPEEMLEFLREQLLKEAKEIAAKRRERLDPNQMALIEDPVIDRRQLARDGVIDLTAAGRAALDDLLKCENHLCDRRAEGSKQFCCDGCQAAFVGRYEIHESGRLGHSDDCNARRSQKEPTREKYLTTEPAPEEEPEQPPVMVRRTRNFATDI